MSEEQRRYEENLCPACHGDGEIRLNHGPHLTEDCAYCAGERRAERDQFVREFWDEFNADVEREANRLEAWG